MGSFVSNAYVLMFIAAAAEKKTGAESTAVERALGRYLAGAPDREGGRAIRANAARAEIE